MNCNTTHYRANSSSVPGDPTLERAGYKLVKGDDVASETAPEGVVVEQAPLADAPLARAESVTVRLSSGQTLIEMPKLVGQSVTVAKTALEKLGLKVNVRWVAIAETATFVVLSQKPEAKTKIKAGSEVELSANR